MDDAPQSLTVPYYMTLSVLPQTLQMLDSQSRGLNMAFGELFSQR